MLETFLAGEKGQLICLETFLAETRKNSRNIRDTIGDISMQNFEKNKRQVLALSDTLYVHWLSDIMTIT